MATPGKPRQSGIPGPGKTSGIPTPGRSRSTSSVYPQMPLDADDISRAFADAIKANDPAQHRVFHPNGSSVTSSLEVVGPTGRRSATGRASSAASSITTSFAKSVERTKTPVSARPPSRPPSRHSDVFGRSTIRAFEVGDNVRIESLGYEGTLQFIGEIDGKLGLWAGVELSGGFAGKGKNNGCVNGKQYFTCPENCGVFVATTKLSPPTVGHGAMPRPTSVASTRGGRITPASSGRVTPLSSMSSRPPISLPNGRVTPSNNGRTTPFDGRITPGTTPSTNSRLRAVSKPLSSKGSGPSLADKITAGSRAAKYMSMTAQQLSSRDASNKSPSRPVFENHFPPAFPPSPISTTLSPGRSGGSPFTTPKPGLITRVPSSGSKDRQLAGTPRARIPSGVAMPPPASPMSGSSRTIPDLPGLSALELNGRDLQEKISQLVNSKDVSKSLHSRPSSVASHTSGGLEDRSLVDKLTSRLEALEYENERLRSVPNANEPTEESLALVDQLRAENDATKTHAAKLQNDLSVALNSLDVERSQIAVLEDMCTKLSAEVEVQKQENQGHLESLQTLTNDTHQKKNIIDQQNRLAQDQDNSLRDKDNAILLLQSQLEKALKDLNEEKKELGGHIDELRVAGQETIALYEERLSAADSQRYELEGRIVILEAKLQSSPSPPSVTINSSATEIDNETLRDQIMHLQRKISNMEDIIEDAHAASEKEEAAFRERMRRLKEKEEGMKKELSEGRKDVDRMTKSEAAVRSRVEEIEEAFRESTVALENARAEVESLRAELANLDGIVGDDSTGDLTSRVSEFAQRAANDRARYDTEISRLTALLQRPDNFNDALQDNLGKVQAEKDLIQQSKSVLEAQLQDITQQLVEQSKEIEIMKKKSNRDLPMTNLTNCIQELRYAPQSPSKHELAMAREEITGLKHIVHELQREVSDATQKIKILESEKHLLVSEADQMRQEIRILEDNLEHSLSGEGDIEVDRLPISADNMGSLEQKLQDQKIRFETELDQLRKRLAEMEMKQARIVHDLNKEISELEALVESKIYREDELEQELERLKDKLARHKKSSRISPDTMDPRNRLSTASISTTSTETSMHDVCEICERPGHDIFNCNLLKDEGLSHRSNAKLSVELFCEDCESQGHVAADCPHSLDVF